MTQMLMKSLKMEEVFEVAPMIKQLCNRRKYIKQRGDNQTNSGSMKEGGGDNNKIKANQKQGNGS